jgi:hypothetical protein
VSDLADERQKRRGGRISHVNGEKKKQCCERSVSFTEALILVNTERCKDSFIESLC